MGQQRPELVESYFSYCGAERRCIDVEKGLSFVSKNKQSDDRDDQAFNQKEDLLELFLKDGEGEEKHCSIGLN